MKKTALITLSFLLFLSMVSDTQRKFVRQNGYDIECHVLLKKLKSFKGHKEYFWFKAGEIHSTQGAAGGFVLHDAYSKYYPSKQLAEQGTFKQGLKDKTWKTWYQNGRLKTLTNWSNGTRQGRFFKFTDTGTLEYSGKYSNGKKVGRWINTVSKDTTYYVGDSTYTKRPEGFFNTLFKRRDSLERQQLKQERKAKRQQDSIKRALKKQARAAKKKTRKV